MLPTKYRTYAKYVSLIILVCLLLYGLCGCSSKSVKYSTSNTKTESSQTSQISSGAISWENASKYIGKTVTIEGPCLDIYQAANSSGKPIFIDIGKAYPDTSGVTALIYEDYYGQFRALVEFLAPTGHASTEHPLVGTTMQITGKIYKYNGYTQIKLTKNNQLKYRFKNSSTWRTVGHD